MIPLRDQNPTAKTPIVNRLLLAVNIAVWLYTLSLVRQPAAIEAFYDRYSFDWQEFVGAIAQGRLALETFMPLVTHLFLHGGWLHVIGNMLYLWIFGNNIEDVMGHARFVIFYLTCGVMAALSHALTDPASTVPMVGASGAISGVLGAYLLLFPRAQVLVLIPLGLFTRMMYVPAGLVLGFWFVLQLVSGGMSLGRQGGGVAFFAHVGGFIAGMALIGLFKRPNVRFFAPRRHSSWRNLEW